MSEQITRRDILAMAAGITAGSYLVARPTPALADPPPITAQFVNVIDYGAIGDSNTSNASANTQAFHDALADSPAVYVPPGTYSVNLITIPSNKKLFGAGETTVIVPVTSSTLAPQAFRALESTNIELSGFKIVGNSSMSRAIYFEECEYVHVDNIHITALPNHNLSLDGCFFSKVTRIRVIDSGALGGYSGVHLSNNSRRGRSNVVSDVFGLGNHGRLVALFGQDFGHVHNVVHHARSGEALYMLDCLGCTGGLISQLGGEYDETTNPNGLSDGVVLDPGCRYCQLSDIFCWNNSGHGISINGGNGFDGACFNVIANARIVSPDECGIAISDQGVEGSVPAGNLIINCVVENASDNTRGSSYESEAYAVSGGIENQFVNCYARDSRTTKKTVYGFRESAGVNSANANHFQGMLSGQFLTGVSLITGNRSSVTLNTPITP